MNLLKRSSKKMPSTPKLAEKVPFVLDIEIDGLKKSRKIISGNVIVCSKCGAYLDDPSRIETGDVGRYFICPYCGTTNIIPEDAQIIEPDTDILISEPRPVKETETISGFSTSALVALIDISGSMAGAKIEAVKQSLIKSIKMIKKSSPDTFFYLVPFESYVYIVDPDNGTFYQLQENLDDEKAIEKSTLEILSRLKSHRIAEVADKFVEIISKLDDRNSTALGPAVVTAYTILRKHEGGRILLLTDGMANVGVGSLDAYPSQVHFYHEMAEKLKERNMIVDIIGVKSYGEIGLDKIGVLSDITEGEILYPDISEIEASIAMTSGSRIIGRDVKIRVIAPQEIKISDVSGVSDRLIEEMKTKKSAKLGMVSEGRELMLKIEPESEIKREKVPIQIQMEYVDESGAKKLRVLSTTVDVTSKEEEILETLDPEITTTFAVQKAGEHEYRGERKKREQIISQTAQLLEKAAKINAPNAPEIVQAREVIQEAIEEFEEAEKGADASAAQAMKAKRASKARLFRK